MRSISTVMASRNQIKSDLMFEKAEVITTRQARTKETRFPGAPVAPRRQTTGREGRLRRMSMSLVARAATDTLARLAGALKRAANDAYATT